jgi:hypothetical protein
LQGLIKTIPGGSKIKTAILSDVTIASKNSLKDGHQQVRGLIFPHPQNFLAVEEELLLHVIYHKFFEKCRRLSNLGM